MPASDQPLSLAGKVAWVTGASRGIGLAIASAFHDAGARVVGFDLEISQELHAVAHKTHELDVASFAAVEAVCRELAAYRGSPPSNNRDTAQLRVESRESRVSGKAETLNSQLSTLDLIPDILVNNAGITRDNVVWKLTEADWDAVLDVNLKGAFNTTRCVAPLMREAKRAGCIVNITSINGLRGKFGQSNYSAAKAGLIGFTKATARELGRFGIRVNAVAPGMVDTPMAKDLPADIRETALNETLLGRLAEPDDVANAVLFLASPLARHITGQVLQVDGGQYL